MILTGRDSFHAAEHRNAQNEPEIEANDSHNHTSGGTLLFQSSAKCHGPQNNGKLLVSQRKSPKTKVRSSVRNTVETEFNGVDDLVNHLVREIKLFMLFTLVDILGDHGNSLAVTSKTVSVSTKTAIHVTIVFQGTYARLLAKATVAKSTSTVVLPAEVKWLQEQHNGNLNDSDE